MKRHVTASLVIVAVVLAAAAYYRAPGLALLAVPSGVGAWLARRRPRGGAIVCAFAGLFVAAIAIGNAAGGPGPLDMSFDVVNGIAGMIALVDGARSAFSRTPVTDLAAR